MVHVGLKYYGPIKNCGSLCSMGNGDDAYEVKKTKRFYKLYINKNVNIHIKRVKWL